MAQDDGDLLVSAVSGYELAQKFTTGRMPDALPLIRAFGTTVSALRAESLHVTTEHAVRAGLLDWRHRDPFDRLLVAQAQMEGAVLVTKDRALCDEGPDGLSTLW